MGLPIISTPTFKTTIPSTGQKIEFRPFLVKEEKVLLMALEGDNSDEIIDATRKILSACIVDEVDIDRLATFDVEYLFLQLRGKSISEAIELIGTHGKDSKCTHKTELTVLIDDIKIDDVKTDKKIMVTDKVGVVVRYPSMSDVLKLDAQHEAEELIDIISSCIDVVFDENDVYDSFTKEEMKEWLENLNQTQFEKIALFFNDIPKLSHEIDWTCEKCGKKETIVIEGIRNFFTLL